MRGKGGRTGSSGRYTGITPACAGKRIKLRKRHSICGEKFSSRSSADLRQGSPPRMRGKVSAGKILLHDGGITPACAGKSSRNETCWHRPWDHPCVCGEKIEMPYELLLKEGSPPRMRGKARSRCFVVEVMRITPAHAGKSVKQRIEACLSVGSPPRMRGKVAHDVDFFVIRGITPACAGKSQSWYSCTACATGSPPRVRGKGLQAQAGPLQGRITPACAGKSLTILIL